MKLRHLIGISAILAVSCFAVGFTSPPTHTVMLTAPGVGVEHVLVNGTSYLVLGGHPATVPAQGSRLTIVAPSVSGSLHVVVDHVTYAVQS